MRNFFIIISCIFACIAVANAQEATGNLIIEGNIKDAYLKIDTQPSELILGDSLSKTLAPGNYNYEISRVGYDIERGTFTIKQGENTVLKVNLTSPDEELKASPAPEQPVAIVPNNDMKDIKNTNKINDKIVETTVKSKSGTTWLVAGGAVILAGIAATALLPTHYTEEKDGYRITGKEYNLLYAVGGLVAGGVCIGKGIGINKKKKQATALQTLMQPAKDSYAYLNMVAASNALGIRLTF